MESSLTQRLDPESASDSPTDWLEPSEEFPILFGLLTARANAQQKSKEKQQIVRRRILRLNRNPNHMVQNLNLTVQEPDSSIRENTDEPEPHDSRPLLSTGSRSSQNSSPGFSSSGSAMFQRRHVKPVRRNISSPDDEDAIPSSTTDDYDLVATTVEESGSDSDGDGENSAGNPSSGTPPRKRSRLEECLMPRLEVMLSSSVRGQGHGGSYQNRHKVGHVTNRSGKITPPKLQEMSITTNSNEPEPCSIPTLNLRELLASGDRSRGEIDMDVWRAHQFRFEKRKYTRRCRDPGTNDLVDVVDEEERPFQCPQCDLKFKRSYHLTRHLTIHSREERFFCSGCKVACFQRKDNLLAHMRKCCPPPQGLPEESNNNQYRGGNLSHKATSYPRPFGNKNIVRENRVTDVSPDSNSWICLSKFMETASGTTGESVICSSPDDPVIGLNLNMVEISEVSPEESSLSSSSLLSSEESLKFSGEDSKVRNKTSFWKSQNNATIATATTLPPNDIGVNLIVRRDADVDDEETDEIYPCGDCNLVFRNLNRLMRHSTTAHVTQPSHCHLQQPLQIQIE